MRPSVPAALLLGILAAVGCDKKEQCDRFESKLRSCDLLTEGQFPCSEIPGDDADCLMDCYIYGACDDLTQQYCTDERSPTLETCKLRCLQEDGFRCEDGSLVLVAAGHCDGRTGCPDGSDEANCPTIACKDGQGSVAATSRCNGERDCSDGSDEAGCPTFACADGSGTVPEEDRCNGADDCPDRSDEANCPTRAKLNCPAT